MGMPDALHAPATGGLTQKTGLQHSEFGECKEDAFRWTSRYDAGQLESSEEDTPSYLTVLSTYLVYIVLILFGHARDFIGRRFYPQEFVRTMGTRRSIQTLTVSLRDALRRASTTVSSGL